MEEAHPTGFLTLSGVLVGMVGARIHRVHSSQGLSEGSGLSFFVPTFLEHLPSTHNFIAPTNFLQVDLVALHCR